MWKAVSTLTGEHAMRFSDAVIDPICEIAADPEASEIFYPRPLEEGEDKDVFLESLLRSCIPVLMREHKESVLKIISANADITVEEYESQCNVLGMAADLASMLTDAGMLLFFAFVQTRMKSSKSAAANIAEQKALAVSSGTAMQSKERTSRKKAGGSIWQRLRKWLQKILHA